jgi:hypothetical protein
VAGNDTFQDRLAAAVRPYLGLMHALLAGDISPEAFQVTYLQQYLDREERYGAEVFRVMDRYFSDVEEFVADPRLRRSEFHELGPEELLASTRELLQRAGLQ